MSADPAGLIPHLIVSDAARAIDYYKRALGAAEILRVPTEDGKKLMHAEMKIGPAMFYLCDDLPEYRGGKSRAPTSLGGTPVTLHQYVPNCEAAIDRAAQAGGTVSMPAQDMFWGDRYGQVTDPFGHLWSFSTRLNK